MCKYGSNAEQLAYLILQKGDKYMLTVKKTLICALSIILALSTAFVVDAATFEVIDDSADKVKITSSSLDAKSGEELVLYVFNPEKNKEDLINAPDGSVLDILQYSEAKKYDGVSISYEFKMDLRSATDEGEVFTYVINSNSKEVDRGNFRFYTSTTKNNLLAQLQNPADCYARADEIAEGIYKYFSMHDFELYNYVINKDRIGKLVLQQIESGTAATVDNIRSLLEKATVIQAFSEKTSQLVDSNGAIEYLSYIDLEPIYLDYYQTRIKDSGIKAVFSQLPVTEYADATAVRKAINTQILVSAIYDNRLNGHGHIETVLSDLSAEAVALGLNTTLYNSSNKNAVGQALINEGRKSATDMIARINELIVTPELNYDGGPVGGSGSGGGSGGGLIISPMQGSATFIEPVSFEDLGNVPWAKESILSLYDRGIVSGKGDGIYAPMDNVTREEFSALIVRAANIELKGASAIFSDVEKNRWSYPYIAAGSTAGLIKGDGVNFYPQNNITREDICAIIVRTLMNKGIIGDMSPEKDFCNDYNSISDYAKNSVQVLYACGIVSGDGSGNFLPKKYATRAEAAVMILKTIQLMEGGEIK